MSERRIDTVLQGSMCIGCGACAGVDRRIEMRLDDCGRYVASPRTKGDLSLGGRVCPFADGVPSEDDLSREIFGSEGERDPHAGFHLASYVGWAEESDFRSVGSSGGLASWLAYELLERGMVDRVVHVAESVNDEDGGALFRYRISDSLDEVRARAKTRYYPVEMSGVLRRIQDEPGRYAVVGVPCFIKALRLVARESEVVHERVVFAIGIVCGHFKSTGFAELLAWQCGIPPQQLESIDFRHKLPGRPASRYGVRVSGVRDGEEVEVTRPMQGLLGADWGQGLFKYKACDFCDDVLAETADIAFGDAWLPEYEGDSRGANVVVVRNQELARMLEDAAGEGRLHLDSVPVSMVVESQAGGFRHRREGLAYRLWREDQAGRWRPKKRVEPSWRHLSRKLRRVHRLRHRIGQASHRAFAEARKRGDLGHFTRAMGPLMGRYRREYVPSLPVRAWRKLRRILAGGK